MKSSPTDIADLDIFFNPESVAVIGASSHKGTVGNDLVKNLVEQGFAGRILPVNPKIDQLYGLDVYHDVSEIKQQIDFALVAIPAEIVPDNIAKAAEKGLKAAAVI